MASLMLQRPETPIESGVEVWTERGFGKVVCRFTNGNPWPDTPSYIVELDEERGRCVLRADRLQVVDTRAT